MLYAAEILSMTKKGQEALRVIERKIMRTILESGRTANNELHNTTGKGLRHSQENKVTEIEMAFG